MQDQIGALGKHFSEHESKVSIFLFLWADEHAIYANKLYNHYCSTPGLSANHQKFPKLLKISHFDHSNPQNPQKSTELYTPVITEAHRDPETHRIMYHYSHSNPQ